MQNTKILFLSSLVLLLCSISCADRTWQSEYDAVMEIHDEVMPEIKTINRIKRNIKKYNKSLPEDQLVQKEKALNLMRQLDKAEEGMFDWMNQFDKPGSDVAHEAAVKYLQAEKVKISQVSTDMKTSIKVGNAFLKEVGQGQ